MNRLWVRLSLAFAVVALLGLAAVLISARDISSDRRFFAFVRVQFERSNGLAASVADYYQAHGSWEGVDVLMRGAHAAILGDRQQLALVLVDPQGTILYHPQPARRGQRVRLQQLEARTPVILGGETIAYLAILPGQRPQRPRPQGPPGPDVGPDFLQEASRFFLQAALLAASLSLLFGLVVSWGLTTPLNRLVEGARAIGAHRFSHRVPEGGSQEFREVARAFNEMAAALGEAETLRRNLLADVAHELRTPLTVLEGNLRAILDDVYALDKAEIARLYDHTRHLHRLVDDLHELAQAEAGQLPLQRQRTDLAELVLETADLFRPLAEEKGVALQVDPENPAYASVDRARIGQVLQNLLVNALGHTPAGGKVTLGVWAEPGQAVLQVADTGQGITPETLPRIFDRFYRTDKARSRNSGGAGLGLAIARALVEAHGGRIQAESPGRGRGSVFRVWLPAEDGR